MTADVQMQHLVGNMLIRNSGATASAESYFIGYHRPKDEQNRPFDMFAGGRYLDELEKRGDEWRIIRRKVVFDWYRNLNDSAGQTGATRRRCDLHSRDRPYRASARSHPKAAHRRGNPEHDSAPVGWWQ